MNFLKYDNKYSLHPFVLTHLSRVNLIFGHSFSPFFKEEEGEMNIF